MSFVPLLAPPVPMTSEPSSVPVPIGASPPAPVSFAVTLPSVSMPIRAPSITVPLGGLPSDLLPLGDPPAPGPYGAALPGEGPVL